MSRMLPVLFLVGAAMVAWFSMHSPDGRSLWDTVWALSILKIATPLLLLLVGDAVVRAPTREIGAAKTA